jgi:nucleotide-binding universal stress UspA family protein
MSTGTIVVGVDGSRGSQQALSWAAEEARLRGSRLRAVHAWRLPLSEGAPEPAVLGHPIFPERPLEELSMSLTAAGARILEQALAGIDVSGLEIERDVVEAAPARALLAAAQAADLLVVGSRGQGGFKGLLLGSVGQQCANHSPCPIVIVPTAQRA